MMIVEYDDTYDMIIITISGTWRWMDGVAMTYRAQRR